MPHSDRRRDIEAESARARLASLARPQPWVPAVPAAPHEPGPPESYAAGPGADASGAPGGGTVPAPAGPRRRRSVPGLDLLRDHFPVKARAALLRVDLQGGHVAVLAVLGVVAVIAALLLVRAAQPEVEPVPPVGAGARAALGSGSSAPTATTEAIPSSRSRMGAPPTPSPGAAVVVDVTGRVRSPGVHRLPAGSRVVDALRASGGALPGTDLGRINLARLLVDGEQVAVGVEPAEAAPAPPPPGAATSAPGSTTGGGATGAGAAVDLNTATLDQLDDLPGVGPVLAQRILDWRAQHGRFSTVEELTEVSGIGDARMADLRPRVRV